MKTRGLNAGILQRGDERHKNIFFLFIMRGTHLTVLAERTRLPARTGRAVMAEVAADMVCVCVCGVSESEGVSC